MRTYLIANPNAGTAKRHESFFRFVRQQENLECLMTNGPGDARRLAQQVLNKGARKIGVVGGDGTISEVVNGLAGCNHRVRLGVIPLGTGNDWARTLALPMDPYKALGLLQSDQHQMFDLIRVEGAGFSRVGINAAAGGFAGQVDQELNDELKASWGPLAFLVGAVNVLPKLHGYEVRITWEDGRPEDMRVFNIVVANGRTAAGGHQVAPTANPQDGLLDVFIVKQCTRAQLARVAVRLAMGDYQHSPFVAHRRVTKVHVAAQPKMWFNVDGELLTNEPLIFTVEPGAVSFAVGSTYQPAPLAEQA